MSGTQGVVSVDEHPARRPRVTVVTPVYPTTGEPFRGIYNFHRARALREWADVEVVCALPRYPRWLRPQSAHRGESRLRAMDLKAQLVQYPAFPVLSRALNARVCEQLLEPVVRASRPDLVLAYWVHPEGLAAVRAAHRIGVPAVVGAMGSDLRMIGDPISQRGVRAALREADSVVTVSADLREIALRLGARPAGARAIPNGCDGDVFRPAERSVARRALGVAPESRLVLFVGRIAPVKGVADLLAAAATAASRLPRFELAVIGEGPLVGEVRLAAANAGGSLRLVGRCEPADVARWLAAADALCLPSRSEGCPNAVIEALHCGRPVIATKVGGVPELVDESCGRLTPAGDPAALAEALLHVLSRDWNGAAIAARHTRSWRDVAFETWQVCEPLVQPRRRNEGGRSRAA